MFQFHFTKVVKFFFILIFEAFNLFTRLNSLIVLSGLKVWSETSQVNKLWQKRSLLFSTGKAVFASRETTQIASPKPDLSTISYQKIRYFFLLKSDKMRKELAVLTFPVKKLLSVWARTRLGRCNPFLPDSAALNMTE